MSRDTIGFNYYNGYYFPVSVTENLAELQQTDAAQYYKIVYIKSGTFHFLLNGKEFVLTGSYAICLNEHDSIRFYEIKDETAKILWFKPMIVNTNFTYEVMKNPNRILSSTELQDTFYLAQFFPDADLLSKIISLHTLDSSTIE